MKGHKFIKFGKKEHMQLLLQGEIYMRRLSYYRSEELSDQRKDHNEGVIRRDKSVINEFKLKDNKITINGDCVIEERNSAIDSMFIYCLFGPEIDFSQERNFKVYLDEGILDGFGDYALLIQEPQIFIERLILSFEKEDLIWDKGFVKYIDYGNTFGEIGPFKKDLFYKPQCEYRFGAFKESDCDFQIFKIGSISDIAFIIPVEDLKNIKILPSKP